MLLIIEMSVDSAGWVESTKLVLQFLGFVGLLIGLWYTSNQLKNSRRIHQQTLEWNRKTYSEKILSKKFDVEKRKILEKTFETKNSFKVIPLDVINKAIKNDENLKFTLAQFLNRCEVISRGISHQIIDEEIVKQSSGFYMIKIYLNYSAYIEYVRPNIPDGLGNFITLIDKWKRDKYYYHNVNYSANEHKPNDL